MTKEEGIEQIKTMKWVADDTVRGTLNMYVTHPCGKMIHCWLTMRPHYCDRGHIQLNIDGHLNLDHADYFPEKEA